MMALHTSPQQLQTSTIPPDAIAFNAPSARRQYSPRSPALDDPQSPQQQQQRPYQRPAGARPQPSTPQQQSQPRSPSAALTSSSSTARPSPRDNNNNNNTTTTTSSNNNASSNNINIINDNNYHPSTPDRQVATAAGAFAAPITGIADSEPRSAGLPISPPPRTSSQQQKYSTSSPSEVPLPDRTRYPQQESMQQRGYVSDDDRGRTEPVDTFAGGGGGSGGGGGGSGSRAGSTSATSTSRTARRAPVYTDGSQSTSGEAGTYPRSPKQQQQQQQQKQHPPAPVDMSRENSEVIDRVVVTDPEVDLVRERERLAEAVPSSAYASSGGATTAADMVEQHQQEQQHQAQQQSQQQQQQQQAAPRTRQDFSNSKRKESRFGDYVLGQTLGEGEFGKVKLGWKRDGSVQVAIKLIRRENLTANPARLPKIYREVTILKGLSHPNIVRLHEKVETERYIGIILEYASGGELFDYILKHRYLKDPAARRLFAQLVSGVGYLHKKGIVHRDLKLENLLLDRNRNIIITDFGFANTFDPRDELGEEIEYNLTNKDFVRRLDLDRVHTNGFRRGDLMQTSCGSPCYAAPELVVTDSLYTGRKVDVWSCGVILYAMLAGYLPFDDDPANPEGDNINLLYRYITSTPLTFPEYVSPNARDLLRRILVPDPRKRADLFEVARHSWLSEYSHLVSHVTSSTTMIGDIASQTFAPDRSEVPLLARSASVREPTKPAAATTPTGGLSHQGRLDSEGDGARSPRDPKRRTVQLEYVPPQSQTLRGQTSPDSQGPVTSTTSERTPRAVPTDGVALGNAATTIVRKPVGQDVTSTESRQTTQNRTPQSGIGAVRSNMPPPVRPSREPPRSVSDSTGAFVQQNPPIARPNTGGSMSSNSAGRLPSRGNSYSQPLAPAVAITTAQARMSQPKGPRAYNISAPIPQPEPYIMDKPVGRPVSQRVPSKHGQSARPDQGKGHKRSSTLSNILSKPVSMFSGGGAGGSGSKAQSQQSPDGKPEKKYPPTSMKAPIASDSPRQSSDSRRPSFTFGRKNSDLSRHEKTAKRFSLLPAGFSLKNFTGGGSGSGTSGSKDYYASARTPSSHSNTQGMSYVPAGGSGRDSYDSQRYFEGAAAGGTGAGVPVPSSRAVRDYATNASDPILGQYDSYGNGSGNNIARSVPNETRFPSSMSAPYHQQQQQQHHNRGGSSYYIPESSGAPTESDPSIQRVFLGQAAQQQHQQQQQQQYRTPQYPAGFGDEPQQQQQQQYGGRSSMHQHQPSRGARVLQKPNRRFADAWEDNNGAAGGLGAPGQGSHSGSSGAAKRVMDFFRRRGRVRAGERSLTSS